MFFDPWAALRASIPTGPEPTPLARMGARAIDLLLEATVAIIVAAAGPHSRPLVSGAIAFVLIVAYETICVATTGRTLGKRLTGLMVIPIDHECPVPWESALKRGAVIGSVAFGFFASPLIGLGIGVYLIISLVMSPHFRAGHDRVSQTYVVVAERRPVLVTAAQLDEWIDPRHIRMWSRLGLVPTLDERRRARARRLERAPWLLAYLVASSLLFVTVWQTAWAFVWLTLAWIAVFTIDETVRIHRTGCTQGHADFGLVVVDTTTGRPPGWVRSALRAVVLGLFMFTPLLPVLALWIKVQDEGRGPHDLIGRTAVITHPERSERFSHWPVAPTTPQARF